MKTNLLLLSAALLAGWSASAQINVRLSVKAVLNPDAQIHDAQSRL